MALIRSDQVLIQLEFNLGESELFRTIPKSVAELFGTIPNQSKNRFVSPLMKSSQKSIRKNLNHSGSIRDYNRMDPNDSKLGLP